MVVPTPFVCIWESDLDKNFFISEDDFKVWLPDVFFIEKSEESDAFNSRKIKGIMSTSRIDRQDESVLAKGLDVESFLQHGHFNDNHSQATSAIVGYPENAFYKSDIKLHDGNVTDGWICEGYVLKGTKRADEIWELAKALQSTPDRRLGFSIEGKVKRRKNKIVEKAIIRNCAITNSPVNTDATWDILAKSFYDEDIAFKAMSAGFATSPATQSGGGAIRQESLEMDDEKKKKKKALKVIMRSLNLPDPDELLKAYEHVLELRPDFSEEAAVEIVKYLVKQERRHV